MDNGLGVNKTKTSSFLPLMDKTTYISEYNTYVFLLINKKSTSRHRHRHTNTHTPHIHAQIHTRAHTCRHTHTHIYIHWYKCLLVILACESLHVCTVVVFHASHIYIHFHSFIHTNDDKKDRNTRRHTHIHIQKMTRQKSTFACCSSLSRMATFSLSLRASSW